MDSNLFLQLSMLLAITVSVAFFVRLIRQPLLVAYIVAGIIAGPLFLGLLSGHGSAMYGAFSEFGVVLLLFIIGLDLNISYLRKIGKEAILIGLFQFIFNFSIFFLLSHAFGFDWASAAMFGLALCFSSTIVVLKVLGEKQDEESVYGRYTIGLMLVQDLISIAILLALSFAGAGEAGLSSIPLLFKSAGAALLLFLASRFVLPYLVARAAGSGEFLFIFTVAWCFGAAALMHWSGLSLEIGAVLAGLSLASSSYHAEIASRIKPLRDFFLVIFFILLGAGADFRDVAGVLIPAIFLSAAVLLIKPMVLYAVFRLRRFTRRNSFLAALTSGQLSEFGFILIFAAISAGRLEDRALSIFTVAAIITIFVSSYLMSYSYRLYTFLLPFFLFFGKDREVQAEEGNPRYDALLFGYHRTGWKIGEALRGKKINFAAVDFNPDSISASQKRGLKIFYGDASDIEFLRSLPISSAKYIISTVPSAEDQLVLIDFVRRINPKAVMIASLYHKKYLDDLYRAGADYVILPHLLGGAWAADLILNGKLGKRAVWRSYRRRQAIDLNGSE